MLRTEQLQVLRAGRIAVADASIEVGPDEAVAIVGPNGAGKSTLLRAISGLERVAAGHIAYAGVPLAGRSPRAILREGIVQVPEGRQLFPELTVQENVWLGGFLLPKARRQANVERMFGLFPRLAEREMQVADLRVFPRHDEVAVEHQALAEAERVAVHPGDDDLLHLDQRLVRPDAAGEAAPLGFRVAQPGALPALGIVGGGGRHQELAVVLAGDDQDADGVIQPDLRQRVADLLVDLGIGLQVERDPQRAELERGDGAALFHDDGTQFHQRCPSSLASPPRKAWARRSAVSSSAAGPAATMRPVTST
jgi:ABC-type Fe3+/spermidine/putrescine transport system ATPase subunit